MGEIEDAPIKTTLDIPVERVLRKAAEKELSEVVVLGIDPDGELYLATSKGSRSAPLFLLEWAKKRIFQELD